MLKVISILTLGLLMFLKPVNSVAQNPKTSAPKTSTPKTSVPKSNSQTTPKLTSTQASNALIKAQVDSLLGLGLDREEITRQLLLKTPARDKKILVASMRSTPRRTAVASGSRPPNQPVPPPPSTMSAEEIADAAEILRCFSPHTVTGNIDEGLLSMIVEEFEIPSLDYLFQVIDAGNYLTQVRSVFQHEALVTRWLQGGQATTGAGAATTNSTAFRIPNWRGQFDAVISMMRNKNINPGLLIGHYLSNGIGQPGIPELFNVFLASTREERVAQLLPLIESTYGISEQVLMRMTIEGNMVGTRNANSLRSGVHTITNSLGSSFRKPAEYWAQVFKLENVMDMQGNPYPSISSAEATSVLLQLGFTNQEALGAIRAVYQN